MALWVIVVLAVIQGLAELLPVSSSAHVIAAAKLLHIDASSPEFGMLIVMLHTGTMFAVIVYFWRAWKRAFFSSQERFFEFAVRVIAATVVTGVIGYGLKIGIEHDLARHHPGAGKAEIEELFNHLEVIAIALAAAGVLILLSGFRPRRESRREWISAGDSVAIGAVQGLCLPFRGFSRSGATISVALLRDVARARAEEYSFALAVVLTPAVIGREASRLLKSHGHGMIAHAFTPSLLGMCFSFIAGLLALKLLSRVLERGQWWVFGVYCLAAAAGVYALYLRGY